MIRVKVYLDGECVQRIDLRSTDIIIGRENTADIQLNSPAVSRRHARLTRSGEGWQVSDLGAANGVYIARGEAEPARVIIDKVMPGDVIIIEKYSIRFKELDDAVKSQEVRADPAMEVSTDIGKNRTQFISMVDVLQAGQGFTAPNSLEGTPTSGPQPVAVPADAWWVRLRSGTGHDRTFMIPGHTATAGAGDGCAIRLPSGPPELVQLERTGQSVSIDRVAKWPFPRVVVDGRSIKSEVLLDGQSFVVGDYELSVHLHADPKKV